jgi:hypothetical protein
MQLQTNGRIDIDQKKSFIGQRIEETERMEK